MGKRGESVTDFEQIYSDYYGMVYGYALTLCRNSQLAEELTQETFFRALKSVGRFRGDCRLDVWLCQIAKNTYLSLSKKEARTLGPPEETLPDGFDLEQSVANRDAALAVHKILHGLPEPYREVFWLRTFGELPFAQIAGLFGKTESWARVTYHRAKLRIKEELP